MFESSDTSKVSFSTLETITRNFSLSLGKVMELVTTVMVLPFFGLGLDIRGLILSSVVLLTSLVSTFALQHKR